MIYYRTKLKNTPDYPNTPHGCRRDYKRPRGQRRKFICLRQARPEVQIKIPTPHICCLVSRTPPPRVCCVVAAGYPPKFAPWQRKKQTGTIPRVWRLGPTPHIDSVELPFAGSHDAEQHDGCCGGRRRMTSGMREEGSGRRGRECPGGRVRRV